MKYLEIIKGIMGQFTVKKQKEKTEMRSNSEGDQNRSHQVTVAGKDEIDHSSEEFIEAKANDSKKKED
ncbi:hypothetical protein MM239_14395 [Belliella sp. DSM 111904]|uniref:Uncharacterized protein n=1 Tax=Belliella filtrata TaxID=2923435 RepID=A0ABS9V2E6_9BACT|nr:hypothetical protein [Belliella filtrata]MCH7410594.1 hypothetical protein [Belliella filtrata]